MLRSGKKTYAFIFVRPFYQTFSQGRSEGTRWCVIMAVETFSFQHSISLHVHNSRSVSDRQKMAAIFD
ncbi:Uncharacterized protein APZ42_029551 [Daphnia magna]|uniref:Uncharacterized protein n=1 Tax=Daphnia magna TaxID=35525 RepID=A0A164PP09_9CRUS|nr:Uncharacterized protein APZ42_029551 [Daphnia magna]